MTTATLNTLIIEPKKTANASIIWMHGLGANAHDFEDIVPQLALDPNIHARFIFPDAPKRPITINAGMVMPAWYDIFHLDRMEREDEQGISASQASITQLIDHEIEKGIASTSIILAGFSQGGAMALHTALRYPHRLAGILALSCYLPLAQSLNTQAHTANQGLEIFMAHGQNDPVLPMILAQMSQQHLSQAGYSIAWHSYPMEHQVCLEEINDIGHWINRILK